MLQGLPSLIDRQFLIGFMAPVVAFLLALATLFPVVGGQVGAVLGASDDDLATVAIAVAAVWLLALGLMLLNRLMLRFYGGYLWPLRQGPERDDLLSQHEAETQAIEALGAEMSAPGADPAVEAAFERRLSHYLRRFPEDSDEVLATRFGNAMRAYERYPDAVYGFEGVVLWPRLQGVMSPDYRALIGDLGAQVNFWVNLSAFAFVMAVLGLVCLLPLPEVSSWQLDVREPALIPFAWFVGGALLFQLSYELAIERVVALGEYMRAAFDLHLPALIDQLGLERPKTAVGREELGEQIRKAALLHSPMATQWRRRPEP